jgi:hypothetical protein
MHRHSTSQSVHASGVSTSNGWVRAAVRWTACLTFVLATSTAVGCSAQVAPAGYAAVPANYYDYPYTYYDGHIVYYVHGNWYYPSGNRWYTYQRVPPDLARRSTTLEYHRRPYVQAAPEARHPVPPPSTPRTHPYQWPHRSEYGRGGGPPPTVQTPPAPPPAPRTHPYQWPHRSQRGNLPPAADRRP